MFVPSVTPPITVKVQVWLIRNTGQVWQSDAAEPGGVRAAAGQSLIVYMGDFHQDNCSGELFWADLFTVDLCMAFKPFSFFNSSP